MFTDYWQTKIKNDEYNRLGEMLGIRWTRDMVEDLFVENRVSAEKRKSGPPNEVTFPLAAILEPSIQDQIKKIFGRKFGANAPGWARKEEEFEDMFKMDKDEFLSFTKSFIPAAMRRDPKNMVDPFVSKERFVNGGGGPRIRSRADFQRGR